MMQYINNVKPHRCFTDDKHTVAIKQTIASFWYCYKKPLVTVPIADTEEQDFCNRNWWREQFLFKLSTGRGPGVYS